MSYILDALKKSESERQKDKLPDLNSIHDRYPCQPEGYISHRRRSWVKYLVTLLLIITVTSAAWFIGKDYYKPDESDDSNALAIPLLSLTEKVDSVVVKEENPVKPTENNEEHIPPEISTDVVTETQTEDPKSVQISNPGEDETVITPTPKTSPAIPSLDELSPLMQAEIPELQLSGHTYADDPTMRMIIINNSILREGEKVNKDIVLTEITWTGVILDYGGQKFTMNIESGNKSALGHQ